MDEKKNFFKIRRNKKTQKIRVLAYTHIYTHTHQTAQKKTSKNDLTKTFQKEKTKKKTNRCC